MSDRLVPDSEGFIAFAGHRFPALLAVRIIRALRWRYASMTEGLSDPAAVRAVIRFWFVSLLADYEGQAALEPAEGAVESVRVEYVEKAQRARAKAAEDAKAIREVDEAPPVAPPTPPA